MRTRVTGALATLALLGILAGIPAVLVVTGALPHHLPTVAEGVAALRAPDDGTLLLAAVTVVGWAAWAVLAAAIVTELAARARGLTAPRLPHGMRWAQGAARALVTAAALTFAVVGPTTTSHAAPAAAPSAAATLTPGHPTTTPAPPRPPRPGSPHHGPIVGGGPGRRRCRTRSRGATRSGRSPPPTSATAPRTAPSPT